jgi:hypothetical protein
MPMERCLEASTRRAGSWSCLVLSLAAVSCSAELQSNTDAPADPGVSAVAAKLSRVHSCEEAGERLRAHALERANKQLDLAVQAAYDRLNNPCAAQGPTTAATSTAPQVLMGGSASTGAPAKPASTPPTMSRAAATPAASGAPVAPASGASVAAETSTTNNQVAEVDEADFVKNDNKYVYAALNGSLRILTAWPAESAEELAHVALPGTPKKLLIHEDRALVFVSMPNSNVPVQGSAVFNNRAECTYGYDCDFGGDGTATTLLVYDISDRSAPRELRRLELRGSLVAARRIESVVHTVTVTPEIVFQGITYNLPGINACDPWVTKEDIDQVAELTRKRNERIIEGTELPLLAPYVREGATDYAADSCRDMYFDDSGNGSAFTSLVALDLELDDAPSVANIVSKAGAVYASDQSLYMAVPLSSAGVAPTSSVLHKFRVGASVDDLEYLASGEVEGKVLNQFSMDEYEDHLRVATTTGRTPDPLVHSTMSVLEQDGDALRVVGRVGDIAPTEDIRSVRFDGKHGFVVTFKKTDPLYMFDLSEPQNPRITGELKIPGFSTYMHMLDDQHLLSIGYDADDQGSFAYFSGVLLQIFDVSDPSAPALQHKTVIGTRGSSSEALTNHLAFTLFNNMLALPMTICEGGGVGMAGTTVAFSGLLVYDVSLEDGLVERGRVEHPNAAGGYDNASCSNWWSRAGSAVQRSIFMDDYVYSIAPDIMRVQNIKALGSDVASVSLVD